MNRKKKRVFKLIKFLKDAYEWIANIVQENIFLKRSCLEMQLQGNVLSIPMVVNSEQPEVAPI